MADLGTLQAIVLAGGKGTRLGVSDVPKPMVEIDGRPLLEHILRECRRQGIRRFLFKTGHLSEVIERHFGDGARWGCSIDYVVEREPLGTAGGLAPLARDPGPAFVIYGDVLFDLDLAAMLAFHQARGGVATVVVRESSHPEDSDVVRLGPDGRVVEVHHKPGHRGFGTLANAALYLVEPACLASIPAAGASDFGRDVLPALVRAGEAVYGFRTDAYLLDVGTPERLVEARADVASGRVLRRVEAVFLDRDGTINEEVHLLHKVEDFRLLAGVGAAIARLNALDIPVVVATNQPVVARNLCDEATVRRIHEHMADALAASGARLTAVYYCPHHPEQGHADANPAYRIDCECRKPRSGMLREACAAYGFDPTRTFMIGDSLRDVGAGAGVGARTILLRGATRTSDVALDVAPDYVLDDLPAAIDLVVRYARSSPSRVLDAIRRARVPGRPTVVLIGGCAQTGKTTLADALARKLTDLRVEVIGLDGWLRDVDARPPGATVFERYDVGALAAEIGDHLDGQPLDVRSYDRRAQTRGAARTIAPGADVVIVEGVVALAVPSLLARADVTVFKDAPGGVRKDRVRELMRALRALEPEAIDAIVHAREADEVPAIQATARVATFVI